jgi:hypothetical protein
MPKAIPVPWRMRHTTSSTPGRTTTSDFFDFLHDAAKPWGDPAQDFVDAWRDATESFASSYANWWGWQNDDSPV